MPYAGKPRIDVRTGIVLWPVWSTSRISSIPSHYGTKCGLWKAETGCARAVSPPSARISGGPGRRPENPVTGAPDCQDTSHKGAIPPGRRNRRGTLRILERPRETADQEGNGSPGGEIPLSLPRGMMCAPAVTFARGVAESRVRNAARDGFRDVHRVTAGVIGRRQRGRIPDPRHAASPSF